VELDEERGGVRSGCAGSRAVTEAAQAQRSRRGKSTGLWWLRRQRVVMAVQKRRQMWGFYKPATASTTR
jgi:hypothetical protein